MKIKVLIFFFYFTDSESVLTLLCSRLTVKEFSPKTADAVNMKFCRTNRKKRKVCGRQEEKLNGCSEGNQSERIMGLEQVQSDQSDQV